MFYCIKNLAKFPANWITLKDLDNPKIVSSTDIDVSLTSETLDLANKTETTLTRVQTTTNGNLAYYTKQEYCWRQWDKDFWTCKRSSLLENESLHLLSSLGSCTRHRRMILISTPIFSMHSMVLRMLCLLNLLLIMICCFYKGLGCLKLFLLMVLCHSHWERSWVLGLYRF